MHFQLPLASLPPLRGTGHLCLPQWFLVVLMQKRSSGLYQPNPTGESGGQRACCTTGTPAAFLKGSQGQPAFSSGQPWS